MSGQGPVPDLLCALLERLKPFGAAALWFEMRRGSIVLASFGRDLSKPHEKASSAVREALQRAGLRSDLVTELVARTHNVIGNADAREALSWRAVVRNGAVSAERVTAGTQPYDSSLGALLDDKQTYSNAPAAVNLSASRPDWLAWVGAGIPADEAAKVITDVLNERKTMRPTTRELFARVAEMLRPFRVDGVEVLRRITGVWQIDLKRNGHTESYATQSLPTLLRLALGHYATHARETPEILEAIAELVARSDLEETLAGFAWTAPAPFATVPARETSTEPEKTVPEAKPSNATSLATVIRDDATEAAYRTAAKQFVKGVRAPLVGLISRHLAPDDEGLRAKVATFLETEVGTAMLAMVLSLALSSIRNPHAERIGRELRVSGMADAGDAVADVLMGPLRQVIALYLADNGSDILALPASTGGEVLNATVRESERAA